MPHITDEFLSTKNAFYQRNVDFKCFRLILPKRMEEIKENAFKFRDRVQNKYEFNRDYYLTVLHYLINNREYTYDEKVAFLIFAVDDELKMLDYYNKTVSYTKKEINAIKDDDLREEQLYIHKEEMEKYDAKSRETFNFADRTLVQYERFFSKKYKQIKNDENKDIPTVSNTLSTKIKADFTFYLINEIKNKPSNPMEDEKFNNINSYVSLYRSIYPEFNYKDVVYQLVNEYNLLGLSLPIEKLTFLVLLIDPNLECLKIYNAYSNWNDMINPMKDTVGFYSKDFIELEKEYYKIYKPNIDLEFKTL